MLTLFLTLVAPAQASPPDTLTLEGLIEHEGLPVLNPTLLGESYRDLIAELGTAIASPATTPTHTLGLEGWEAGLYEELVFTEAIVRDGVSPWERSHPEESPPRLLSIPSLQVRKGLPLSTEVGFRVGWLQSTGTGVAGGSGRIAILEGYKPLPDVAIQIGYSGFIGHEELELGVTDLTVQIGTQVMTSRFLGIASGHVSPWASFSSLRVQAVPRITEETRTKIGAVDFRSSGDAAVTEAPIVIPQGAMGIRFASQGVHLTLGARWAPSTLPAASVGLGLVF